MREDSASLASATFSATLDPVADPTSARPLERIADPTSAMPLERLADTTSATARPATSEEGKGGAGFAPVEGADEDVVAAGAACVL